MKVNIHTHHPKNDELTLWSIGIHPYDAEGATTDTLLAVERTAAEYNAIGEIGLDFSRAIDREVQIQLLQAQLDIAQKDGKGVVLHCVKAFETVMDILKNYSLKFVIFHGFIGSPEQAKRAIEKGYFLSFGDPSFASPRTVLALEQTPLSSLFLESDERPVTIEDIYAKAAVIKRVTIDELKNSILENYDKK